MSAIEAELPSLRSRRMPGPVNLEDVALTGTASNEKSMMARIRELFLTRANMLTSFLGMSAEGLNALIKNERANRLERLSPVGRTVGFGAD